MLLGERQERPIHLLLLDFLRPVMKGPDLPHRPVFFQPGMKVLYLSGCEGPILAPKGLEGVESDLVTKPFAVEELSRKVREVLDRGRQREKE